MNILFVLQFTSFTVPFTSASNITKPIYIPTQVVQIGDEILDKNSTSKKEVDAEVNVEGHYLTAQWQPVLEYPAQSGSSGNALDQESARAFPASARTNKAKREQNDTSSVTNKNDTLILGELVMATVTGNTTSSNLSGTAVTDPDTKLKMSLMGEFVKKDNKKDGPPYEFVKPESLEESGKTISRTKAEIKEPILPATTPRQHRRSSKQGKWHPEVELYPPSMGATESWHHWEPPPSNRRVKNMDLDKNNNSSLSALTIQFLPQRLISFLEQAEKYARLAFSPFLSNDNESKGQRRLRFLPNLWWGKSEDRTEKKLEEEVKEKEPKSEKSEHVIAIPYLETKTDMKPKYIPLTSTELDTKLVKAETDFNRPKMIKDHLEEPIIDETKDEEKKDR